MVMTLGGGRDTPGGAMLLVSVGQVDVRPSLQSHQVGMPDEALRRLAEGEPSSPELRLRAL